MDEFKLGTPALVCRWRLANGALPLQNRHLRALASRRTVDGLITTALVAWAKQHLEWTLSDGSVAYPNGVLMLVMDTQGQAAMTVGEYRSLGHTTANDLLFRAQGAWAEAESTSVAPEELWVVRGNTLVRASSPDFHAAGASSLVVDLARTLGMPLRRDENLLVHLSQNGFDADEAFLVSDEYGVVPASDRAGERAHKFAQSYAKLLRR